MEVLTYNIGFGNILGAGVLPPQGTIPTNVFLEVLDPVVCPPWGAIHKYALLRCLG